MEKFAERFCKDNPQAFKNGAHRRCPEPLPATEWPHFLGFPMRCPPAYQLASAPTPRPVLPCLPCLPCLTPLPGVFCSLARPAADGAYLLAFAIIMLNTDAHNPMADRQAVHDLSPCTKQQFLNV
jgi:Sec7-like guanine-nucleotide exchange factor